MRKGSSFSCLIVVIIVSCFTFVSCGNPFSSNSSSKNGSNMATIVKSDAQKKTEHYMNTKSDLLRECTDLHAIYREDKFHIYMKNWNNSPIDTIYKADIYNAYIENLQLGAHVEEALPIPFLSEEEERKCAAAEARGETYVSNYDREIARIEREKQQRQEKINSQIRKIKSLPDWNDVFWVVYEFTEEIDRTYAVSGGTEQKIYKCYSIYAIEEADVVTVFEKKYNRQRLQGLLVQAMRL